MAFKILVTDYAWPSLEIERRIFKTIDGELVVAETGQEAELVELARQHDVDAILTCWKRVTAAVLDAAPHCQTVCRYGVGLDNIDVERADTLGMLVTRVPDYCVDEVAEHTLALLLAGARGIATFDRQTRSGSWDNKGAGRLRRLRGQTVGIVGLGNVGRAVAQRARGLGFEVIAYHPRACAEPVEGVVVTSELKELLQRSDHVSLHVPLTAETENMIDGRALEQMKPGAFLINTARGALIDEEALRDALVAGQLAGAALDVLVQEPAPIDHPLIGLDNVIITPHAAFSSEESIEDLEVKSAQTVVEVLSGRRPREDYLVNPEVLDRPDCRVRLTRAG